MIQQNQDAMLSHPLPSPFLSCLLITWYDIKVGSWPNIKGAFSQLNAISQALRESKQRASADAHMLHVRIDHENATFNITPPQP